MFLNLGFNIFACFVLGDSFYRVYKLTKGNSDLQINSGMMLAHILSYALFIIAMFLFLFGLCVGSKSALFYSRTFNTLTGAATASQLILIAIFNIICKQQEHLQNG